MFATDPESKTLSATESQSWILPEIVEGSHALADIILEPAELLASQITFERLTSTVFFTAD